VSGQRCLIRDEYLLQLQRKQNEMQFTELTLKVLLNFFENGNLDATVNNNPENCNLTLQFHEIELAALFRICNKFPFKTEVRWDD